MAVDVLDRPGLLMLLSRESSDAPASFSLQTSDRLLGLLSQPPQRGESPFFDDITPSELRRTISGLGRCGHARFRRAPGGSSYTKPPEPIPSSLQVCYASNVGSHGELKVQAHSFHESCNPPAPNVRTSNSDMSMCDSPYPPSKHEQSLASFDAIAHARMADMDQACVSNSSMEHTANRSSCHMDNDAVTHSAQELQGVKQRHRADMDYTMLLQLPTATTSSFMSSLSTEGGTATNTTSAKQWIGSGRPPLPPKKRKPVEQIEEQSKKHHRSRTCHCVKHRKSKGTRVFKVSAIGLEGSKIPVDKYSWCKYGQKTNKWSSTRVYYRCSSFNGCPARKHVERAFDDPSIFIVTYGRDHVHSPSSMARA